jgi:K+/H+ antiporter YhaU regulatory subunit KhtT
MLFAILEFFFAAAGIFGLVMAVILIVMETKRRKEYKFIREEDTKTISQLTREKENLREEIIGKLASLTNKEEQRQDLLLSILKRLEEEEKGREGDLMNWLEFKAKKWHEQVDERVSERLAKFQQEMSILNKKFSAMEGRIENIETKLKEKEETPQG